MQYSREHIEKIHKDVGGLEGLGYQERLATLHGAKVAESWYDRGISNYDTVETSYCFP